VFFWFSSDYSVLVLFAFIVFHLAGKNIFKMTYFVSNGT